MRDPGNEVGTVRDEVFLRLLRKIFGLVHHSYRASTSRASFFSHPITCKYVTVLNKS